MSKVCLFAFNGDPTCFVHVLLNALDMKAKGHETLIVIEGAAVKLVPELAQPGAPLHGLYVKVKDAGLIGCVCRACSLKMGVLAEVEAQGLPLGDDMSGHPSMADFTAKGFTIITF
jgi:hypothetical protein